MPYYMPEQQGVLSGLIGAAATYFDTQQKMKDAALARQKSQYELSQEQDPDSLQNQYLAAQTAAEKATARESTARAGYEEAQTKPMDQAISKMITGLPSVEAEPNLDPKHIDIPSQIAAYQVWQKHLGTQLQQYNTALQQLALLPPATPGLSDMISSVKEDIREAQAGLAQANTDIRDLTITPATTAQRITETANAPKQFSAAEQWNLKHYGTPNAPRVGSTSHALPAISASDWKDATDTIDYAAAHGGDPAATAEGLIAKYGNTYNSASMERIRAYGKSKVPKAQTF